MISDLWYLWLCQSSAIHGALYLDSSGNMADCSGEKPSPVWRLLPADTPADPPAETFLAKIKGLLFGTGQDNKKKSCSKNKPTYQYGWCKLNHNYRLIFTCYLKVKGLNFFKACLYTWQIYYKIIFNTFKSCRWALALGEI